jgi:hypothetical protein
MMIPSPRRLSRRFIYGVVPADRSLRSGWGAELLGASAHSMIFEDSKLGGLVPDLRRHDPFRGRRTRDHRVHDQDPSQQKLDGNLYALWTGWQPSSAA